MHLSQKTNELAQLIRLPVDDIFLEGDLVIPEQAKGLVIFAHGSGSGRLSPRNRFVAKALHEAGLATLLADLLTKEEEKRDLQTAELRFDIDFLSDRLRSITKWVKDAPQTKDLSIGYFGASTGAAAALIAASADAAVKAVVSRGGRPDLATESLELVKCPTLLIVGGADGEVVRLNQRAYTQLHSLKQLEIIPHATHLFEEPHALDKVAVLAADWFLRHL